MVRTAAPEGRDPVEDGAPGSAGGRVPGLRRPSGARCEPARGRQPAGGRAILEIDQPYHPIGQPNVEDETLLEEEWEHHRYAVHDLDTIDTASGA